MTIEPIEIALSKRYKLILSPNSIGNQRLPAVDLKVRHVGDDGQIFYKGLVLIAATKLRATIEALLAFEEALAGKPIVVAP